MIFFLLYDKLPKGNTDGMKWVIFLRAFHISKSIGNNIFFIIDKQKNYRRKIHQLSIFIYDSVGKLIVNGMIVQKPTKNFVGKYKNSSSEFT